MSSGSVSNDRRNQQAKRQKTSLRRRFSRTPEEVGGVEHVDVTDRTDATRVTWPAKTMGWMYGECDPKDDSFGWL